MYLLTVIDWMTRWLEGFPLMNVMAEECANAFKIEWVACYGVPADIMSDHGRQFTSALWSHMAAT